MRAAGRTRPTAPVRSSRPPCAVPPGKPERVLLRRRPRPRRDRPDGEPAERVALAQPVTHLAPQAERPLAGVGRLLPVVQQRCLVGEAVIQAGDRGGIGPLREAQCPWRATGSAWVSGGRWGTSCPGWFDRWGGRLS